jgi:hypothetical protein
MVNEEEALGTLREWMKGRALKEMGTPTFARFDPPWTPSQVRRNEMFHFLPSFRNRPA